MQSIKDVRAIVRRQHRSAVPVDTAGRRCFLVILASGVAIQAWALLPAPSQSEIHLPIVAAPGHSASRSATTEPEGAGETARSYALANAERSPSESSTTAVRRSNYPSSAVTVSQVPLRSKLEALVTLLGFQTDDPDAVALQLKLLTLLTLPDHELALLMTHPDLVELSVVLNAAFLGHLDLSRLEAEFEKVQVAEPSGDVDQIQVIEVNGTPVWALREVTGKNGRMEAHISPVSPSASPPGEPEVMAAVFAGPIDGGAFDVAESPRIEQAPPAAVDYSPTYPSNLAPDTPTTPPPSETIGGTQSVLDTPSLQDGSEDAGTPTQPTEDRSPTIGSSGTQTNATTSGTTPGTSVSTAGGETGGGVGGPGSNDDSNDKPNDGGGGNSASGNGSDT